MRSVVDRNVVMRRMHLFELGPKMRHKEAVLLNPDPEFTVRNAWGKFDLRPSLGYVTTVALVAVCPQRRI